MENNKKLTDKSFHKLMFSSIASIFICMICLASMTWAWFSTTVESSSSVLASASYEAHVQTDDASVQALFGTENQYVLGVGSYYFTVTQSGTSEAGYCVVIVYDMEQNVVKKYYAGEFGNNNPLNISLAVNPIEGHDVRALIKIVPVWGYYSGSLEPLPLDGVVEGFSIGEVVEEQPAETTAPAPETTFPTDSEASVTEPIETEPTETEPTESEAIETEATDIEPAESKPVESEPAESEPVDSEPVDSDATETPTETLAETPTDTPTETPTE